MSLPGWKDGLWPNTDVVRQLPFEDAAVSSAESPDEPAQSAREGAVSRLRKRRDFQGHLVAYVVVNAALWIVWAVTGGGYPWPAWVTGGWAIGLVLNAWDVYLRRPITEADIEREIERSRSPR
jgi:2TM domain